MRDLRYTIRVLFARPGFSAVAILTLALGIGANTAIFTVVNAVLLRPLPFRDPHQLVLLIERTSQFPTVATSWQNYVDWRDRSRSFEAVAAVRSLTMTLTGQGEPDRLAAKMVTASLLPVLGVSPSIGRGFAADEDRAGAAGVVLVSDALWQSRFGARIDVIGRAMTLDSQPYTIVGVLPPRFQLLQSADVLLPMGPWAAMLVVAEMALATVLLVGAGLLTKSLLRLQEVSTGFNATGVLVADAPLSPVKYATAAQRNALVDRLRERLRALPGVALAEVATAPPFSGNGSTIHFDIAGRPPKGPEEYITTGYRAVGEDYFRALGIPVVGGRAFSARDRDRSPAVAVVNETFLKRFFGAAAKQALGTRAQLGTTPSPTEGPDGAPMMEIVGVVGDTKQAFESTLQPTLFVPYEQYPIDVRSGIYRNLSIVLKTAGNPAAVAGGLRAAMQSVDPDQPLMRVRTMEDAMAESVAQPRLRTMLLALFSGVALLLSLIGVYGVMAYSVSERTHELGVRIALGASPADIRALVVGEGTRLALAGIAIGLVGALTASQALGALLFGVSATDPVTFVVAAASLAVAALAAAYAPARRASRIDPVVLLR